MKLLQVWILSQPFLNHIDEIWHGISIKAIDFSQYFLFESRANVQVISAKQLFSFDVLWITDSAKPQLMWPKLKTRIISLIFSHESVTD